MAERPVLMQGLDGKTFRDFYYLKEELADFCRKNGLSASGGKAVPLPAPSESAKIEPDLVCSERHRAFFKKHFGTRFSFCVPFQTW